MHESALIFVPAGTFGQLIPKCDTAPQQLPKRVEIVRVNCLDSAVDLLSSALGPPATIAMVLWRLDFSWMTFGRVFARPSAEKSPALAKLVGEALQVEKSEAGGGLICWDGKNRSGSST
jgi:hypothetical protein